MHYCECYHVRELKKLWIMRMKTATPIIVEALGTITKNLEKRLEELKIQRRLEIIQITVMLRSALALRVECSLMACETRIQSQVKSYQRFKKWYLIPRCLTLRIIRYIPRVKWSNSKERKSILPYTLV